MKIIFDFDHTLFSAKKLYTAIEKTFENLGVDENLFKETFEKSKEGGIFYNNKKHLALIAGNKPGIDVRFLRENLEKVLNRADQFLYPDVLNFLKKFERRYSLYTLSYGEDEFQRRKIDKSGIRKFFREIYVTEDVNKVSALKKFLKREEKAIFVDDNLETLSEIKKIFPKIITVRINRGEGKYRDYPNNPGIDFSIKNLRGLEKILLNLTPSDGVDKIIKIYLK